MGLLKMVFAGVLALALCLTSARAAEPLRIRLAWVVPLTNWGSILFEKKDILAHYGQSYVVDLIRFQNTPAMITALATHEIDIADFAFSSYALAIQNAGMDDLRVIADEVQDGFDSYYSAPYSILRDGPIKQVEDLKGKVVASIGAGGGSDIAMRAFLRKHGLEDKRDYSVVEVGFPSMRAVLADRKVDLIQGALPFTVDPEYQKISSTLFTIKDAFGGSTQLVVWTARQSFLDKNRAAMIDFMEDSIRAVHFLIDPNNRQEMITIAARVSKLPPTLLDSYLFTKNDLYRDANMIPDLVSLQHAIDIQRDFGFLKNRVDVQTHSDLSIVREAGSRLK